MLKADVKTNKENAGNAAVGQPSTNKIISKSAEYFPQMLLE